MPQNGKPVASLDVFGIPLILQIFDDPFGGMSLIVKAQDVLVAGITMEKNRNGVIEFHNRVPGIVRVKPEPSKPEETKKRDIE